MKILCPTCSRTVATWTITPEGISVEGIIRVHGIDEPPARGQRRQAPDQQNIQCPRSHDLGYSIDDAVRRLRRGKPKMVATPQGTAPFWRPRAPGDSIEGVVTSTGFLVHGRLVISSD